MKRWVLTALLGATPLSAQQDSLLLEAVRLATEGQSDSARAVVQAKLRAASPSDSGYAEILFTAGLVSDTAAIAARFFRQVSIEYSESTWADRALLRLAQLAYAQGDLDGVRRSAERILLDYPFSPVRAQAAFWAGRTELDRGNPREGCRLMAQANEEAGENVELANRAAFYLQRCSVVLSALADSTGTAGTEASGQAPTRTGTRVFAVQVAAVSDPGAADRVMRALSAAGHEARVFRDEDGLLKVRVGAFRRRRDAEALLRELRELVPTDPFIVEERR